MGTGRANSVAWSLASRWPVKRRPITNPSPAKSQLCASRWEVARPSECSSHRTLTWLTKSRILQGPRYRRKWRRPKSSLMDHHTPICVKSRVLLAKRLRKARFKAVSITIGKRQSRLKRIWLSKRPRQCRMLSRSKTQFRMDTRNPSLWMTSSKKSRTTKSTKSRGWLSANFQNWSITLSPWRMPVPSNTHRL